MTTPIPARWYCVSRDGLATLCTDQWDAQAAARHSETAWSAGGPHRAVLLGDVAAEPAQLLRATAEIERLRARVDDLSSQIQRQRGLLERAAVDLVRADYGRAQIVAAERERCAKQLGRLGYHELARCLRTYPGFPDNSGLTSELNGAGERWR